MPKSTTSIVFSGEVFSLLNEEVLSFLDEIEIYSPIV